MCASVIANIRIPRNNFVLSKHNRLQSSGNVYNVLRQAILDSNVSQNVLRWHVHAQLLASYMG